MGGKLKIYLSATIDRAGLYLAALGKWLVLSCLCGGVCGLIGTAFHLSIQWATGARGENGWLVYCLPLAGLLIVGFYKLARTEGVGTNRILDEVHDGKGVPVLLLPAIFFGTFLTHLCGGSAGREGAALQMGGTVGYQAGRLLRFDDRDLRTATMAGMAAFFSALFGTPVAATVFAMTVASVGISYAANLLPSFLSALIAYGVAGLFGVAPERFAVQAPEVEPVMLLKVMALGILCGLVSMLFCGGIHLGEHLLDKLRNPWVRVAAGGCLVILLTLLSGTRDYNGAGMDVIARAIEGGEAAPAAFLLKILFTAVTLGAGFKGGEVVPSFFVGATFGCVAGGLLGVPAGFAAAVGLAAVFCGATNCPIASILLAAELFGGQGTGYFAAGCVMSFFFSGYGGLYSSQKFPYSKLKARFLGTVYANQFHEGKEDPVSGA